MEKFRFQWKHAAVMVACFAVCIMFSECAIFDEQLRITFTDIPAEYNGKTSQASLCDEEGYVEGSGASLEIINGKTTIYFEKSSGYYRYKLTTRDKGKYIVVFHIKEEIPDPEGDYTIWHWEGESKMININKIHTTVSFNTLQIWDDITYPYTFYGMPPGEITITDIPPELSDREGPPSDYPLPSHCYYREGFVYLLKPDDRELCTYSYVPSVIKDRKTTLHFRSELDRGKYIVVFKLKETSCNRPEGSDIIFWEGESEPMDLIRKNTTISFNTFKKWDRSYPYTTDQTEQGWKDRD